MIVDVLSRDNIVPLETLFQLGKIVSLLHVKGLEQGTVRNQDVWAKEGTLMALVDSLVNN